MDIKFTSKDFKLIDEVLEDYKNKGRTDKICIHCDKPMKYIKWEFV